MIKIKKSPSADSRSVKGYVSVEDLTSSTLMHINDVRSAMSFIKSELQHKANNHDHTKMENMEEFHFALTSGKIKETSWYQKHITQERHHLKSNVPEDVNLLDVIEHIVDCTMAGLARSGDVYDTDISPDVLVLAVENTVKWLKENTEVVDDEEDILNETINNNQFKSLLDNFNNDSYK